MKYEEKLSVFSPVNYIDGIDADKVIIRLGTHDLLIAFEHGKKLVDAFVQRSKKTSMKINYRAYLGADHASALFFSSLEKPCHNK